MLVRFLVVAIFLSGTSVWSAEVEIHPVGVSEGQAQVMTRFVLEREDVQAKIGSSSYRVLRADFGGDVLEEIEKDAGPVRPSRFRVRLYDYSRDRLLDLTGDLASRLPVTVEEVSESSPAARPAPTPEEFEEAVSWLRADPYFSSFKDAAGKLAWAPYMAMPGVIAQDPASESRHERVISVGIIPARPARPAGPAGLAAPAGPTGAAPALQHEIVGVNLSRHRIIRYPTGAPPTAVATPQVCAPPDAGQYVTGRGTAGQADLTITKDGVELWRLRVVRPSASAGVWGGGVEVRNVIYRGRRVLSQASAPILNVKYDGNYCGPYRDWMYSESAFQAEGELIATGILKATGKPQTINESGSDVGNFRGVAVYSDGTETVLVSEVAAGWYRYRTEFRFDEDGTIRPRWAFAAIQDSCTCHTHHHHAYWRLDFDIGVGTANRLQVSDGSRWSDVAVEERGRRDLTHQQWRVLDPLSGAGYDIVPGTDDGTADDYGRADFWALRQVDGQMDDSQVNGGTSIGIDAFVNGQSLVDQDLVFWYGAHFDHVHEDARESRSTRGPTLKPFNW